MCSVVWVWVRFERRDSVDLIKKNVLNEVHTSTQYKRIFYEATTTDRQLNVEYCTVWNNEELSMNILNSKHAI